MTILDGQTAFILGASAGIAQASARLLAADGATLFLLGRSSKRLDATRDRILEHAPTAEVHLHKGDPEDEDTVKKAAQAAFDVAGRLDIVVGTVATVRLELNNWTGSRFTDLFTLLKVDGEWKIMNKVFHLHPEQPIN